MIKIEDIQPGKSYACKFKVETMLDTHGRIPGLSDTPPQGIGTYEGLGILQVRDLEGRRVQLQDEKSGKEFVVTFDNIWDVDEVEWTDDVA